jgi:tetratricopeptide (TPR) repeat protein
VALGEQEDGAASRVVAQEAVDVYRRLAAAEPEQHQVALAVALTNLAVSMHDDGGRSDALAAVQEAVSRLDSVAGGLSCDREQAAAQLTLAYQMAGQGRYTAATAAAAEAVRLHLSSAADHDGIVSPAFGAAAMCLADLRLRTGQYEDALQDAARAAEFYRRMETERHGRYSHGLAEALETLAGCQDSLQLRSAAQSTASDAVELCRRLARTDPGRGEALLACALGALAARCDHSDEPWLGNDACAEAVERFQLLTRRQREKHGHEYLMALCDHARRLGSVERAECADIAHDAVRVASAGRTASSRWYVPLDHAEALTTLAECLRQRSRRRESHAIARQVADSCRRDIDDIDTGTGDGQWAGLADREQAISQRLYALGYLTESLDVAELAVQGYRAAADAGSTSTSARYGLARSLRLQSAALRDLPRRRAAAQAADHAIVVYRELAGENPGQFLLPLASALDQLADCHRRSQARMLRAEAQSIRRADAG